ncbi:4-aminobutyrate aminotransferase apoenzyme [Leifsonia sp. 98AMF]|uniref:aminotransferase class III-fold pyridoxal phosphate-dependent enzyme n=1 Tax=unclassified Leifsonia TaxID=2663824 RepID=UPI0008795E9E|nr:MULTISPECIES: aminotransferase class III-fold pyridoxal phosphate-dependent enzyme [unclassified Leifsonia]SDH30919.1 4-aminobutyrate aminotransferase apoenzyme [Leifsonia sp. 197AMF]SDJ03553.1 4-aminobutyrate aminotransferase apoenzyme [Leifsonia sp. 466MF]SDJ69276.1 4-aminobutyrate aminotransferase apoenzyme [Leifsonia sp. 157MF]SDO07355.1 4-aminobutyrate aminotransferase apoenzyme [Leifsonia sp. 509MF]SEM96542.1 4-aminobutyrate aminotransferase apoenzyme [Leifsonia sp. 467MF]
MEDMTREFSVPQSRHLVTELPGPRSVELQQRRVAAVSRGAGTLANIYMESGSGAILVDVDGNRLIDLGCGIGVTTIGHAHPAVAAAAAEQAAKLTHTLFTVTPYENYVAVAEKLAENTPGDFEKHSILVNSGAEAVENAVKIARKYTGRRAIATLDHAFHGRTNLTMAMTYRPWPERAGMGPFPGEIYSLPISYPFRDPEGMTGEEAAERTIDYIRTHIGATELAALFVEPIQGDGGIIIPAPGYFARLAEFCAENGIVFVADEIQAGIGRTGTWYSIEHHGVVPDLVTSAKGIAGGFPLAAVTGRAEIMDAVQPGGIGGTFGGNPVSTAAALAVFQAFEDEDLLGEARRVEKALWARIGDWAERFPVVGEVRGKGAMFGIELVVPGTKKPNPEALTSVLGHATRNGVIPLDAGSWDSVLRLLPSVVISEELIDDAATVLEEALGRLG